MKVRNKKQSSPKFCQFCEKEIFYPRLKFCSMRCCDKKASIKVKEIEKRKRAERRVVREALLKSMAGTPCAICGEKFDPIYENQKYCSKVCSKKNKRRRDRSKARLKSHQLIKERLSNRLRELLSKKGLQKQNSITKYMGCSPKEMMAHIESKFHDGMSWSNYGVNGWHLDHIIPCKKFDLSKEDHCHVCFNWRNIRPLWGKDNWTRQHMLQLSEALDLDPVLIEMAKGVGVELWS